jgi:hypothetical protein
VGTGTKEDESNIERVWASGFHSVTARSRLVRILKLMNRLFLYFSNFFGPRQTADTESVDTGARLYAVINSQRKQIVSVGEAS